MGLSRLSQAGYRLVVISNQSGVARGLFPESALIQVETRLRELLLPYGVNLAGVYYCPHHPDGSNPVYARACDCRKPRPGMILKAANELDIDLEQSWMIGDILDDIEAGRRSGLTTILINNGNETEWVLSPFREPHFIVDNLEEAARTILSIWIARDSDLSQLTVE